jgi:general stress protein 26
MKTNSCLKVTSSLVALLFSVSSLLAQENKENVNREITQDSLLRIARTIIDSASCNILITVDVNGKPHARQMSPFPIEDNWVIWLGTSPISRKAKQIQNNPNVIVYYYRPKGFSYVSIAGTARLVNDSDLKAKYWINGWERYFPDREKDYILIEVTPENLEIVSYKHNLFWDSKWAPRSVDLMTK